MLVLKVVVCLIMLIIIPEILGLLVTKNKNILLSFIIGYFIEFSILEILAVPMIFLSCKFTTLLYTWSIIILGIVVISIIVNLKNKKILDFKNRIKDFFKNTDKLKSIILNKSNIVYIIAIVLVGVQVIASVIYTHTDDDDAFYIGTASTTLYENSMYKVSAENGSNYGTTPARYVLAPFPLYTAIISSITHINPVIVAHIVFPPIFILLAYSIYILLAEKLFNKNKIDVSLFIILLSILYIFGNYSIRTNFTFLLFRIWQGKAILANIILPGIWLMFLNCIENEKNIINWILLLLVIISACLVSEMGIALAPLTLGILSLVFTIRDKKVSYLLKSITCIIPCIICFIIYVFIK